MASVTISDLTVIADGRQLLTGIDLAVSDGDFFVVMGPSGSGKTTLLRTIAGLERPTKGEVWIGDRLVLEDDTERRRVAMMFQDNVLFSFTTAGKNVAFPLEVRGVSGDEVDRRVQAEARVLAIQHLLDRRPETLSAGYQQLVQAARAMVQVPEVFLMDEPVARMDPQLREVARRELSLLQKGYGVTTVWATNDPVEAMAIADRIVVLDDGKLSGAGTPAELYARPPSEVAAQSLGVPPMRIVAANVTRAAEGYLITAGDLRLSSGAEGFRTITPGSIRLGIRPEDIVLEGGGTRVSVVASEYHGDHLILEIEQGGVRLAMRVAGDTAIAPGDVLEVKVVAAHFFDPVTGKTVAHQTYWSQSR
jgi:ABC-type sugar transport system ATPase subunit